MGFHWQLVNFRLPLFARSALVVLAVGLVILLLVVIIVALYARARRRERLISEAMRSGQPELARYLAQGPRRVFAGILLFAALVFLIIAIHDRERERMAISIIVAAICLVVVFKRPRLPRSPQPLRPPQGPGEAEVPPATAGFASPPPPPGPGPAPVGENPNGFLEKAIAIAMAILIVLAGLVLIGGSPGLVLLGAVGVLVYLVATPAKRAKCFKFLGKQAGILRDWLDRKASRK